MDKGYHRRQVSYLMTALADAEARGELVGFADVFGEADTDALGEGDPLALGLGLMVSKVLTWGVGEELGNTWPRNQTRYAANKTMIKMITTIVTLRLKITHPSPAEI